MDLMEPEAVAQAAIIVAAFTFAFARLHDEAGWGVSAVCGTMPVVAFLAKRAEDAARNLNKGDTVVWLWFSISFVMSFCLVMLGVKVKVSQKDMDRLLSNTMSLLLTGITSAHVIFALSKCPLSVVASTCISSFTASAVMAFLRRQNAGDVLARSLASLFLCFLGALGILRISSAGCGLVAVNVSSGIELSTGSRPSPSQVIGVLVKSVFLGLTSLYFVHTFSR